MLVTQRPLREDRKDSQSLLSAPVFMAHFFVLFAHLNLFPIVIGTKLAYTYRCATILVYETKSTLLLIKFVRSGPVSIPCERRARS